MGTTYHWIGSTSNWETGANWTPSGGPPGSADNAIIDQSGTYTVTVSANDSLSNLTLSTATATLAISDNHQFTVNGTAISNAGTIDLNSAGNGTYLIINSAGVSPASSAMAC
jgi:hypothetical protein